MKTAFFTHPDCQAHPAVPGHLETPARLDVILEALNDSRFDDLIRLDAPKADRMDLLLAHSELLVETVLDQAPTGDQPVKLDYDTVIGVQTPAAALRAAGSVCAAVDGVMDGSFGAAFCAVRPPGHHAEIDKAMGFCFFSSIAIAALQAKHHHGLSRIAIVDFDVHHGNGTQDVLKNVDGMYFGSIHQHRHYPDTGTGVENIPDGPCIIRNVPMPAGTPASDWREAFEQTILADLDDFKPELILVSAGFDAHRDDPLGAFNLTDPDYAWLGQMLKACADKYASGRLVSALEGGYNLPALASSVAAYIKALQSD